MAFKLFAALSFFVGFLFLMAPKPELSPAIIYDLRSTCLTGLERLGIPGPVVSAVANHAPTTMTKLHYSFHDFASEKGAALAHWGDHVEKIDPMTIAEVIEIRRKR